MDRGFALWKYDRCDIIKTYDLIRVKQGWIKAEAGGTILAERYDKIIIGAGIYGLYAALFCGGRGQKVLVLECDPAAFSRATYVNQARVHQGYHYPRSLSTAVKSAGYFARFNRDFHFCINKAFDQIYATSEKYSWTNATQFKAFCAAADIPCEELCPDSYFKKGMCDGAFRTREYTYDAAILKDYFLQKLQELHHCVAIRYGEKITDIHCDGETYIIETEGGEAFSSGYVLNAAYAGTNQILRLAGMDTFGIKYELCEIILCEANEELKQIGLTVMDGPFFSIMPFGKTGLHSLTAVTFTPHMTSYQAVPEFSCQKNSNGNCSGVHLGNCNTCPAAPDTAFPYMSNMAEKYMLDKYRFKYKKSLFSMKPILVSSEVDDSRPTVIRKSTEKPAFVSVLSGKINTIYDLDEVLLDGE